MHLTVTCHYEHTQATVLLIHPPVNIPSSHRKWPESLAHCHLQRRPGLSFQTSGFGLAQHWLL